MLPLSNYEILIELGFSDVEAEMSPLPPHLKELVEEYRMLYAQYHDERRYGIWLEGDYGTYTKGKVVASSKHLVVVDYK